MVPGSASFGLVAPISLRAAFTTPGPSHTLHEGGAADGQQKGRQGRVLSEDRSGAGSGAPWPQRGRR